MVDKETDKDKDSSDLDSSEEESEALETVAMVIAEMIAAGGLEGLSRPGVTLDLTRPVSFDGVPLCDGIGIGRVVLHEPRVVVSSLFNEDADSEVSRLTEALAILRESIEDMLARRDVADEGEHHGGEVPGADGDDGLLRRGAARRLEAEHAAPAGLLRGPSGA